MKCYECVICLSVNHSTKPACSVCGTIPAMYSLLNKPTKPIQAFILGPDSASQTETTVAFGAERCISHHAKRVSGFKTVTATYYAASSEE